MIKRYDELTSSMKTCATTHDTCSKVCGGCCDYISCTQSMSQKCNVLYLKVLTKDRVTNSI